MFESAGISSVPCTPFEDIKGGIPATSPGFPSSLLFGTKKEAAAATTCETIDRFLAGVANDGVAFTLIFVTFVRAQMCEFS
eukprot:5842282-Amphidinium_carterae.2